jgi:hypothetical protein
MLIHKDEGKYGFGQKIMKSKPRESKISPLKKVRLYAQ